MDKLSTGFFLPCSSKYKMKFLPPVGKKKKILYRIYVGFGLLLNFVNKSTTTIVFLLKELLLRFIVCLYLEGTQNTFQIAAWTWQASVPLQRPVDLNDVPNT